MGTNGYRHLDDAAELDVLTLNALAGSPRSLGQGTMLRAQYGRYGNKTIQKRACQTAARFGPTYQLDLHGERALISYQDLVCRGGGTGLNRLWTPDQSIVAGRALTRRDNGQRAVCSFRAN